MGEIKLGCIAKDKLTGFEGTVIAQSHHLNNCDQFTIQPKGAKEGKPVDSRAFDVLRLEFVKNTDVSVFPQIRPSDPVDLGDEVQDTITGVKGVVLSRVVWLDGCSRLGVQPKLLKDGLPAAVVSTDEKDAKILSRAHPKPKPVKSGGPRQAPQRRTV